jgi:hypothetical protein
MKHIACHDPLLFKLPKGTVTKGTEVTFCLEVSESESPKEVYLMIKSDEACDYTYENDIITFKCSSSDISFSEFYIEGVEDEAIEQSMAQMRSQMSSITNQITNVKINGNTLTGIFNGNQITLKRI